MNLDVGLSCPEPRQFLVGVLQGVVVPEGSWLLLATLGLSISAVAKFLLNTDNEHYAK